jgi:hypothetical protein
LSYELSDKLIDLGYVVKFYFILAKILWLSLKCVFNFKPYDEISEAFISIRNLGKVTIEFSMIGANYDENSEITVEPDVPIISPIRVIIDIRFFRFY